MSKSLYHTAIFLFLFLLVFTGMEVGAQTYRILPLGNSLTQGWGSLPVNQRVSYRLQLDTDLSSAGHDIDYVGHASSGWSLLSNSDHCGIPNTRDQHILQLLQNGYDVENDDPITSGQPYLDVYTADIILLHIGTNDILNGEGSSVATITDILNEVDAWEAANGLHVTVFVAQIVNTNPSNATITAFNTNLASMVAGRGDPNVILVNMETGAGIDYLNDFEADGVHLLQAGYDKMGVAWNSAVGPYLSAVPAAPDNVSFGTVTSNSMQLNWTDNSDNETGFEIERSLTPDGGDFIQAGTVSAGTTSFTSEGLAANTTYYFRIRALNGAIPSLYTTNVSGSTSEEAPNPPQNLTFGPNTNSTIQLNWEDQSNDENGFEIFMATSLNGEYNSIALTAENATSYIHSGLSSDTEYFYRVYAYNGGGSSSFISGSASTLPDAPDAPSNLTFGTITSSSIELNWSDNSNDEEGFEILMSTSSSGGFTIIGSTPANVTTFTSTELDSDTRYYYRVVANNAGGTSSYTSGNELTLPDVPAAPSSLTFSNITNSSIQLNWKDESNNEDGFEILRSQNSGGPYDPLITLGPGMITYNNTGLDPETEYFYRVTAFNAGGSSAPASGSAVTLPDPPVAPSNLTSGLITTNSIQIMWSDNSDNEDGFEIHRSLSLGGPYAQVGSTNAGISSYNDVGLQDDTEYFYRVYAVNAGGVSDPAFVSASTLMQVPNEPSRFDASSNNTCAVDLRWDDRSNNEDGFEVERSTSSSTFGFSLLQTLGPDVESYLDTNTQNFNTYYYRVRAFNEAGYSDYSTVRSVTISEILDGGSIGTDQSICPQGDAELLFNIDSPSGGSNNWSYQWQSRSIPGIFEDIEGATMGIYDPPPGMLETTEFQRISTVECGSVSSNVVSISVEDLEDPVFDLCPENVLVQIDRDQTSVSVITQNPQLSDNCEIGTLTYVVNGATSAISPATGINNLGPYEFNLGISTVTYRATDLFGNYTECSFEVIVEYELPEILSVSIPDAVMKIGDVISATIITNSDGGSDFNMVSGEIGAYPLYNFQRIDETTYLANFEVVEGGNSYLATEDIPVNNLIISDGTETSLPYNLPIIQGNDLLDAELPVIDGISAQTGTYGIGDELILDIIADGVLYDIHPSSTVNEIAVSEPNMLFSEVGGGIYRLSYTIQEGDEDVAPGELVASIMLVKPSGNIGLPYLEIGNTDLLSIDAHAPVILNMEVADVAVGVGGTIQVTLTADEEGYILSAGTIINGIPISSPQISFSERTGGLYEISYVVAASDAEVAPGELIASIVMTDSSGNSNEPFTFLEENSLEVYTDLPVALLAGTPEICEEETAELTVFLEGREPWSFDLYDGSDTVLVENVSSTVYNITVAPMESTSYRILKVRDVNGVENNGSGNVPVKVNEKTAVQIINLASGYNYQAEPVKLEADVPGGVFSGPGVFSGTGFFDPGVADTINSPHTIYYRYVNSNGCESLDSALVFVLGANGGLYIPSDKVCQNGDPFSVNASNISGVTGIFTLLNSDEQPVDGLIDNGDNSAVVDPGALMPGEYTIEYEYVDLVTLYLTRKFTVEAIAQPNILNLEDSYCQDMDPILLESDMEGVVFVGQGVEGSPESGFFFDPSAVEPGEIKIYCTATSESGCEAITEQAITVLFSPSANFALSNTCIVDTGGTVNFVNLTYGKLEVETWNWDFGDPSSGENNTSTLVNPEHYYETPGERSVRLIATAFNGCISEKIMDISIGDNVTADFTWTSECYAEGSGIHFMDRSTTGNSVIDTLIWRFKTTGGEMLDELISSDGSEDVSYQFPMAGEYVVELIASNNMGCSDSASADLSLKETIKLSTEDYQEGFDLDQGNWTVHSEDQRNSWTWNAPDFEGFPQQAGDYAWFTKLPENEIDYHENSWVQSPCFDFSGVKKPMISMDIMRSFVPEQDGAVLQYLVNREDGWQTVGDLSSGIAWYNSESITNEPGGSQMGWSLDVYNPDQNWVYVAHDLDMLAQEPSAMLRIAIGSNGKGVNGNQGFAFDNVNLTQRTKLSVIEHFTNSADAASRSADDFIDGFVEGNISDVVDLQYHMDRPGNDPMNENNPDPSDTRFFNYGVPSVPYAVLNGGVGEEDRFDFSDLKSAFEIEQVWQTALQKPLFDVDLEVSWGEGSLAASTLVTCNVDRYDDNVQLYLAVIETSVTQYTGLNGDTEFRNVVLELLPTPLGEFLGGNWRRGDENVKEYTWIYEDYVEHIEDLAVVAFIQKRNSEILQAAVVYKTPQIGIPERSFEVETLYIYPNPAKTHVNVNLGRPAEKDGRFEIIDMNGRVVQNENVPMGYQIYQLEVGSLNRGFYMIQWYEGGKLKGRNKLITVD